MQKLFHEQLLTNTIDRFSIILFWFQKHKIVDSANQIDEKGLPLGNTISQLSANVYLNELVQYAKRKLRLKYYVRYMDDVIVVVG